MKSPAPVSTARPSTVAQATTEHDRLIARLLNDPKKAEALKWLQGAKDGEKRTIGSRRTTATSVKLVENLYRLGASEVVVVQIQAAQNGDQHTGKLVIKLPKDIKHRRAIFEWCQKQGDSLGFSPDLDAGESYLFLLLD